MACLLIFEGCASVKEDIVFWSRQGEIENARTQASLAGIDVQDEAYRESLKRWPFISSAGLQRRALLYSLLKTSGQSLAPWASLSSSEDLNLELSQIVDARTPRNVF